MQLKTILYDKKDSIAIISFNRPKVLNAQNRQLVSDFLAALKQAEADLEVRAVIVKGEGRAFCSGDDLSSVKFAVFSGEKVSAELIEEIREKIAPVVINGYGSTEAGPEVTFTEPDDDPAKIAQGYAGKPLPTVKIKIVDDDDNELPQGEVGEVIISGPLAIKSYFNQPEEDKVGFTSDGWVRTGDLGYLTEDGGLYIQGRKKQIIRVGSYTVLPTEVEEVALKSPDVAMAMTSSAPWKKVELIKLSSRLNGHMVIITSKMMLYIE